MESIGTVLRNERTNRGISLAEAHEATKITVANLDALEEDRFESFPNRVYARAFLRDYANYLGLDSHELLERYEAEWGPKPELAQQAGAGRRSVGFIAAVFLVLVAIAGYAFYNSQPRVPSRSERKPEVRRPERPPSKPAPKPQPSSQPGSKPTTTAALQPPKPAVDPARAKELKLQLTGTNVSWMRVQADQQAPVEFTLSSGQVKSFTAKDKFTVRIGSPSGVKIHLNGQTLPQLGPAGRPVTKELDRTLLKPASAPAVGQNPTMDPSGAPHPANQ